MFARLATLLPIAALVALVAANDSQCSTGELQCCNSTQMASPTTLSELGGLLGLVLPNIQGLIGLTCTPITAIGVGSGSTCTAQTVCCTNNSFNGLVSLGCTPVNLSL